MTMTATLSPGAIRPLLQNKIGQMDDSQVEKLHRVMQKLEAQQLWDEIKADGARDRARRVRKTRRRARRRTADHRRVRTRFRSSPGVVFPILFARIEG